MQSLTRRFANRVRSGLSRRVSPFLERAGLRAAKVPPGSAPVSPFASGATPAEPLEVAAPSVGPDAATLGIAAVPAADDHAGPPMLTREQVEKLFEEMVRPALQSDGGDISLVSVQNNDVYVELQGACHSCPSSIVTMEQGIERLLREEFPHFGRLLRVDG